MLFAFTFKGFFLGDHHLPLEGSKDEDRYVRPITPAEIQEAKPMGRHLQGDTLMLVGETASGCRTRLAFTSDEMPPIAEFETLQQQTRQQLGKPFIRRKRLSRTQIWRVLNPKGSAKL